ncbi:hypothetical protein RUND412_000088 [Rhizina undulata]
MNYKTAVQISDQLFDYFVAKSTTSENSLSWPSNCSENIGENSGRIDLFLYDFQPETKEDSGKRGHNIKEWEHTEIASVDFHNAKNLSWRRVLVIGELKGGKKKDDEKWSIQFAYYVREIFYAQPRRRFVHAFLIHRDKMRMWLFHRSGAGGSQEIDIKAKPQIFLRIIGRYSLMEEEDLGFDPTIQLDEDGNRYVTIPSVSGHFVLEPQSFFSIPSISSRGTTCWLATKNGKKDYVEYKVNGIVDNIFNNILKGIDHGDNLSDWILRDLDGLSLQTSTKQNAQSKENILGQISNTLNTSRKAESGQSLHSVPMGSPDLPCKSQKNTASLQDRIHTRLINRCGKRIEEFKSVEELLEALREATNPSM